MSKKTLFLAGVLTVLSFQGVFAFQPRETARYFNGPTVTQITDTTARVSLSQAVLAGLTEEEKQGVYFQYYQTRQVCIMIYPTPEHCLPKKTEVGKTEAVLTNLKPNTSYTIVYKRDNTIRCITTPCPGNEFESLSVEFTTGKLGSGSVGVIPISADAVPITTNLSFKSRGAQVMTLQTVLIQHGFMTGEPTGYFGVVTLKAVKDFQKAHGVNPTGYVGPLTRAVLANMTSSPDSFGVAEKFEGKVTAYSVSCFADGECSITVDGKKVVTTIGWSQKIVGKVTGIPDFGSIENNIGAHAKVYAKKTSDGYTLYGNADYYVDITPVVKGKLPAGSIVTPPSAVQGRTWVWQQTAMGDAILVPSSAGSGTFTVTFGTDGTISGTTDCNGFFGTATFGTDGFMTFGPLGSSKMYCYGSHEQVFTSTLAKVNRYNIDASGKLLLMLSDTTGTMYFVKK